MDKYQTIAFIEGQLKIGNISREDLLTIAGASATTSIPSQTVVSKEPVLIKESVTEDHSRSLIHVLYAIGAIIAVIGVGILVAQNWVEIGFIGRIFVTLGISLVAYVLGLLFKNPEHKALSQVMFTVSAALAPLGTYVFLNEAGIDFSLPTQIITASILSIIYGSALLISKRNILVLITIGFASWLYYALILNFLGNDYFDEEFLKWSTILLGAAYLFIGYAYQTLWVCNNVEDEKDKKAIQNVIYGFGTLAILGTSMFLGGIFDILLIGLIFGAFYGSVYVRSGAMLMIGSFFLMAHIIKLTSEYFVDSIGWPIALIAVGFLIIAVGYMTFYLNKRFISSALK